MNSAGKIEPGWRAEELQAKNAFVPPRLLVELVSRGLFLCALSPMLLTLAAERIGYRSWHVLHAHLTGSHGICVVSDAAMQSHWWRHGHCHIVNLSQWPAGTMRCHAAGATHGAYLNRSTT